MKYKDLSIFSGNPAFSSMLHVGHPNIGNRQRFLELMNDMLDRRWFSNDGPYVKEFEKKIAEYLGVKHCIAMCNGTIALEIVIRALELKGEVIVPSFTFIATAHALQWQEITPVFCDIDPGTHHIDPKMVEKMITPRTTGILGVHIWGRPCDVEALSDLAQKHKLKLLFDAAHAFGCSYNGRMIGNFGSAEVFSFHATKFFNTMEGGAVVTNDDDLARKMRLMKNFGFAGYDNVIYIGTNGKMNEASAAMGLTNIESIEEIITINQRNYECYRKHLTGIPGINLLRYAGREKHNYQYITIEIDEAEAGLSRDGLQQVLWAENILARRYFYPGCHGMEPYKSFFPHAGMLLPETESKASSTLCLPTGTAVGTNEISVICEIIKLIIDNADLIRERIRNQE
ncbi:MAG: aminotransferase class I/II-fold pyridoxal phosphate-dependent enzyme [Deltaproteobacteria bacterium]|nr:aminotransferase class I/II-fold pyridoxal phosphate-dependent enzyme [Deltaproteobacteria bacterium]